MKDTGSTPLPPVRINDYLVQRVLGKGTLLALGAGERRVVLKRLDDDCLVGGKLHPSIRERLGRVRELAHRAVANLHGVEREGTKTFLVWEYVEGINLDEWNANKTRGPRDRLGMARDVLLAVEALHTLGLVHGALHGKNIIIRPDGNVLLTHISPLLYSDPAVDVTILEGMLVKAAGDQGEARSEPGSAGAANDGPHRAIHRLITRANGLLERRVDRNAAGDDAPPPVRRKALIAAGLVILAAATVGFVLHRLAEPPSAAGPSLLVERGK